MKFHWMGVLLLLPIGAMCEELVGLEKNPQLLLSSVLEKTFERNPQRQVWQAGKYAVESRQIQAASLLPGAPAVSVRHQNDTIGSGRNLREWEAALEMPVWLPGQRAAREIVAHESGNLQEAGKFSLMLDLAGQVRDAIWDVAMNLNNTDLAEQRLKTAQGLQIDVEKRWKAGELAKTDFMLAQNESLQAQSTLLLAKSELKHAEHRYWMLTGLKELPANEREQPSPRTTIEDDHPLLAETSSRIKLAQEERNLTQLEKRENPQFIINMRNERGSFDETFSNSVGIAMRIPLEAKVRSAPMLAGAEQNLAQAISEHEKRKMQLQTVLHEAKHNLEVTRAGLDIVQQQDLLAQENLKLIKKAFDLGETDLVSLLRVRAIAQEANQHLRSQQTKLQWGIARYNQAVGVLP